MPYRPLAAEAGRVHVCAHRGHSIAAPENTLPALIAAAEHGATCCEIDVVLTRDDEIVLLHDEILDRTTDGRGRVADYDLAALRELDAGAWFDPRFAGTRVPTLAEALADGPGARPGPPGRDQGAAAGRPHDRAAGGDPPGGAGGRRRAGDLVRSSFARCVCASSCRTSGPS